MGDFFGPLWMGGVFGFLAILLIGALGLLFDKVRLVTHRYREDRLARRRLRGL